MVDFTEISYTGDTWELFARDFLRERGFFIESPPDRGPDAGKDLLITEHLSGNLNEYPFRWLVSCKHFAKSGNSVSEDDERNILERLSAFSADGFIGFYSTLASSGLNTRLNALRNERKIKDYSIFDHKLIENLLVTVGYSHLMMRYFPNSYKVIKPLHLIVDEYLPLECKKCGKDLLMALFESDYNANIVMVYRLDNENDTDLIQDVYCCCKSCDETLRRRFENRNILTGWYDISDLVIPIEFLRYVFGIMNKIRNGYDVYTDEAFGKMKNILMALAQKVLRATTERERERFKVLMSIPSY
jgi:hypothetical protein